MLKIGDTFFDDDDKKMECLSNEIVVDGGFRAITKGSI